MSLNVLLYVSKVEVFGFTARPVANLAKLWSILLHRSLQSSRVLEGNAKTDDRAFFL